MSDFYPYPEEGKRVRAEDIELGCTVLWYGRRYKIDGWFFDARGRMVLEFGGRNHVFWRGDRLTVVEPPAHQ